jgi:hypothetical protein
MGVRVVQIVAIGSTDEPLSIEVEIANEATGKHDQYTVSLNPPNLATLGQAEGVNIQQGDVVKLRADGYADLVRRVF